MKAFNAISNGAALGDCVIDSIGLRRKFPRRRRTEAAEMSTRVPTIVLGGTGYVAGELLRLIAGHPNLKLAGDPFGQPAGRAGGEGVRSPGQRVSGHEVLVASRRSRSWWPRCRAAPIFSAAPHGASAALIDRLLAKAEAAGTKPRVVDISADYRYSTAAAYAAVYKHAHGAPSRLSQFTCAVPEHLATAPTPHVAHPGCFATAILLASVPLLKLGLATPQLFVTGVTGSTGSGRKPIDGTHHPLRHSDLYAYNPLAHRHTPEVAACAKAASGVDAHFAFVPHSGPFARGIHVTVQAQLAKPRHHGRAASSSSASSTRTRPSSASARSRRA